MTMYESIDIKSIDNNIGLLFREDRCFSKTEYQIIKNDKNSIFVDSTIIRNNGKTELIYITQNYQTFLYVFSHARADEAIRVIDSLLLKLNSFCELGFLSEDKLCTDLKDIMVNPVNMEVYLQYVPTTEKNGFKEAMRFEQLKKDLLQLIQKNQELLKQSEKMRHLCVMLGAPNSTIAIICSQLAIYSPKESKENHPKKPPVRNLQLIDRESGRVITIDDDGLILGRKPPLTAGIISADKAVGRKHCEIVSRDGQFLLKDLGSINGTSLNGRELDANHYYPLEHGDTIQIVHVTFSVQIVERN